MKGSSCLISIATAAVIVLAGCATTPPSAIGGGKEKVAKDAKAKEPVPLARPFTTPERSIPFNLQATVEPADTHSWRHLVGRPGKATVTTWCAARRSSAARRPLALSSTTITSSGLTPSSRRASR